MTVVFMKFWNIARIGVRSRFLSPSTALVSLLMFAVAAIMIQTDELMSGADTKDIQGSTQKAPNIEKSSTKETVGTDEQTIQEGKQAKAARAGNEPGREDDENESGLDEGEEDDDISIIINPETADITDTSQVAEAPVKTRRKPHKIYHNNVELTDLLNAAYNTGCDTSLAQMSFNGKFEHIAPLAPETPQAVFFPPLLPPTPFYKSITRAPQGHSPLYQNGVYGSGSQVMAEYLARSLHDNYLYAATVLGNEGSTEDVRKVKRPGKRSFRR